MSKSIKYLGLAWLSGIVAILSFANGYFFLGMVTGLSTIAFLIAMFRALYDENW